MKEGEEAWHIPLHIVDGDNVIKTTFDEKEASFDVQSVCIPFWVVFFSVVYFLSPSTPPPKKIAIGPN